MQNTIKLPTIGWGIAALVAFPFNPSNPIAIVAVRLLMAALFGYFAYKSYRNGLAADATPKEQAKATQRNRKQLAAAVGVIVVGVLVGIGTGLIRLPNVTSALPFTASIEGKYRDPNGNTVEFLGDSTAIIVIGGQQAIWKWSTYDDNRLKLEPGPGVLGVSSAMCNYQLNGASLRVTGCDYAMQLTRI
jgi:hypothetical protein